MTPIPEDPNMAQAWISGTPPDQTIDFYIPRGNTGLMGPQGPIGPSLAVGNIETVTGPAAPGTVGATGLTGPQGIPGGLVLGVEIGTTNLDAMVNMGFYPQSVSGNVTIPNGYPAMSPQASGFLTVYRREIGGTIVVFQRYDMTTSAVGSRAFWERTLVNTTWTPWRSFTDSRVDQTAGRAIYQWDDLNGREQLIYGDTGVRDIKNSFINGWTATLAHIVRKGSHVTFSTYIVNPINRTDPKAYIIPSGFKPADVSGNISFIVLGQSGAIRAMTYDAVSSSIMPNISEATSNGANQQISWVTNDPWPTSLPGTALGSIPNT